MSRRFLAALPLIYFQEVQVENRRMAVAIFVRRYFAYVAPVLCLLGCLLLAAVSFGQAIAFTTAPGYAATDFATGFVNSGIGGIGPVGLAFDASGNLFVGDYFTGFLYKFGPGGGVASAATQLNNVAHVGAIAGLAFTKDGRLYLARQLAAGGDVVEVDPTNGAIMRRVAFYIPRHGSRDRSLKWGSVRFSGVPL